MEDKKPVLTAEQKAAIECEGKVIVSASAGSGKTFVMIQKIIRAIEGGVDLDNVLAVTFTKKAAAQMKEKLRQGIIDRLASAQGEKRDRLKLQLTKVNGASISTIHSFAAKLVRTYFYVAEIDGGFSIMAADDAEAKTIKYRAIDNLFERCYESDDKDFKLLLKYYVKKRDDKKLQEILLGAYEKLRTHAEYIGLLDKSEYLYTEQGFDEICNEINRRRQPKYEKLQADIKEFAKNFKSARAEYGEIFAEMIATIDRAKKDIFSGERKLTKTKRPTAKTEEEKAQGEAYGEFRDGVQDRFEKIVGEITDRNEELKRFSESGKIAVAFSHILKEFDVEYTKEKLDKNKLDYEDLEHLTLKILQNEQVLNEIGETYKYVFVDEYQDVNPVQDSIIKQIGGNNLFLVGDVKQAIYGFRGSKSFFFKETFDEYERSGKHALKLNSNFRSSTGVIGFVNSLFSKIMRGERGGINYKKDGEMVQGGAYPSGYGAAKIVEFGKDEKKSEDTQREIYSVKRANAKTSHTRQALCVKEIVKRELGSKFFDLKEKREKEVSQGDICILTRKNNEEAQEIARALIDSGYNVSGMREGDIFTRPEVKTVIDILSLVDNGLQDIPLATALLSPLGGLTHDELAQIRLTANRTRFYECCTAYASRMRDTTAQKLLNFYKKIDRLRDLSEILTAAEMADRILEETGLEGVYSAGGGEKLANVRKAAKQGEGISVAEFLLKIKSGGTNKKSAAAGGDSIKIMTMHASKGLEFPVVIIADVCATYRGRETSQIPFAPEYGFAHKAFDEKEHITHSTLLRTLIAERKAEEELENEYNLFYVACTRAMCRLYVLARELPSYSYRDIPLSFAGFADLSSFERERAENLCDFEKDLFKPLIGKADEYLYREISKNFKRRYEFAESINLPVKSSASAILKTEDKERVTAYELFPSEYTKATGAERGTAYHRFLELCDFAKKSKAQIEAQIENFFKSGAISASQKELLNADELYEILNMPVFDICGDVYRERAFLCRLKAKDVFENTLAEDYVLLQGAIDLLVVGDDGVTIVDYKYSAKSDEDLKSTYIRQLMLYKKAVALIFSKSEEQIKCRLVNIFSRRTIELDI